MKGLLAFLLLLLSEGLYAQYGETIRSGRPGLSIGPNTVGEGVFQVQAGVINSELSSNFPFRRLRSGTSGIGVFRFGLSEPFELGIGLGYQVGTHYADSTSMDFQGVNLVSPRMRVNLFEGHGAIPTVGFQLNLDLPVLGEEFQHEYLAPKLLFVTSQKFGKNLGLTGNYGLLWDGHTPGTTGYILFNMDYRFFDKFGTFLEYYSFIRGGHFEGKLDGGFFFLLSPDLQLDLFGGYDQTNDGNTDWFISGGVSWRAKLNKSKG